MQAIIPISGLLIGTKCYRGIISQEGVGDPVVIIQENLIGDIVWTRYEAGVYLGTLAGAFPEGTTGCSGLTSVSDGYAYHLTRKDNDTMLLNAGVIGASGQDGLLFDGAVVDIRVP